MSCMQSLFMPGSFSGLFGRHRASRDVLMPPCPRTFENELEPGQVKQVLLGMSKLFRPLREGSTESRESRRVTLGWRLRALVPDLRCNLTVLYGKITEGDTRTKVSA